MALKAANKYNGAAPVSRFDVKGLFFVDNVNVEKMEEKTVSFLKSLFCETWILLTEWLSRDACIYSVCI